MSPSPRTPPRSAPVPHRGPWPACATSPSASSAPTATATSPPRYAATPATPPESYHSWASQARETDTPALCRGPGLYVAADHQEARESLRFVEYTGDDPIGFVIS